ncbi:ribonuclease H-like domain-containing protein [Aspergillus navahoensis]
MVGVLGPRNGEVSEVVRLAAVDFLSGEVLINTFVEPGVEQCVKSWRTRVSGVSRSLLDEMKKRGQTVQGWRAARGLLWGVVNEQTILIGHSLHHDLAVLRMVHARVVDSAILTRDAVAGGKAGCTRLWALKTLARTFLGLEIQTGKDGHDCLEDTFAARDVVLWCLANPTKLGKWAAGEREIVELKKKNKQT